VIQLEINLSLGFISYLTSAILFLFVLVIYFVGFQQGRKGRPFLLLIAATLIWSSLLTLSQIDASSAFELVIVSELIRYFTWFYVLQSAAGLYQENPFRVKITQAFSPLNIVLIFLVCLATLALNDFLVEWFDLANAVFIQIFWLMLFSIIGLILVEQLFRNTTPSSRWLVSFLCLSAGAIFIYDFFVFSNALLIGTLDYEFWSARGLVNVFIIPTLLIAATRNPVLASNIHISRQFVYHSATLFGAGVYLIVTSILGYYVKETGGEWGKVLQVTFLFASLLLLTVLFFSPNVKARVKRYLSYSFRNKYDYREEWNRFSRTLLTHDPELSLDRRALQAISQIVDAEGSELWIKDNKHYVYKAFWGGKSEPGDSEPGDSKLIQIIKEKRQLLTRDDFLKLVSDKDTKDHWFAYSKTSWLIVPLWINSDLFGFVHLRESIFNSELDIEDVELLNTVAHQVSLSLFLKETDTALQQAQKFSDMNQMTTFLIHDLKTVLSQLSLLVENSEAHKHNPAFIDDMINTVLHTTQKMHRLMQLLKNPGQKEDVSAQALLETFGAILESFRHNPIQPTLINHHSLNPIIKVNQKRFFSAMENIVQNAVESCDKNGEVKVELQSIVNQKLMIHISDNGKGMTQDFILERLFRPFDSTKGVSGMGMGVYQSREFLRSIDGELSVRSEVNVGTQFTIEIPVEDTATPST
jgi:putative PEP-CTERM system histidine kinase